MATAAPGPRLLSPTDGVFEPDMVATILLIGDAAIDKMALAERLTAQQNVEARLASALPLAADDDRPAVDFVCFLVGALERCTCRASDGAAARGCRAAASATLPCSPPMPTPPTTPTTPPSPPSAAASQPRTTTTSTAARIYQSPHMPTHPRADHKARAALHRRAHHHHHVPARVPSTPRSTYRWTWRPARR